MIRLFLPLLAASSGACGDSSNNCSGTPTEKQLTVETPTDPSLQLKVDSCRVDVDACPALCAMAMQRTQITFPPDSCTVGFEGEAVHMKVLYTAYAGNCFFGDGVATPGGF